MVGRVVTHEAEWVGGWEVSEWVGGWFGVGGWPGGYR